MKLLKAKYVTLSGTMTVAGMSRQNFDASRDLCELHLHQETGGVLVTPHMGPATYVGPLAITSVELCDCPDLGTTKTRAEVIEALLHSPSDTLPDTEAVQRGARNLADEVLAELSDAGDKPKRRTAKKR